MRRHRDAVLITRFSMLPFTGVLLVPLIIYMAITPPISCGILVQLPKALHARAVPGMLREDAMLISIERDGKVYMNTEQVAPDQIVVKINDALKTNTDPRLYIKADSHARYKMIKDVLSQVPFGLAPRITFIVEQPR